MILFQESKSTIDVVVRAKLKQGTVRSCQLNHA